MPNKETKQRLKGIWYTIASFTAWGILPLYWKALKEASATEILAHRILWSFIFVSILLFVYGRWNGLWQVIKEPRKLIYVFLSSILISANWFSYIWAVNSKHVVETSLGYYITPLLNIILGILVLKERLNFWQFIALLLAGTGVIIMTTQYGHVLWVAFILAFTFGLYGLVKKLANLDSLVGLAMETAMVAPIALVYLAFRQIKGTGAMGNISPLITLLLLGAGVVTAIPLIWFAQGAKRVPLSTVGFIQYISPTITLLMGIFLFKEKFTGTDLICFELIWCALALYTLSQSSFLQGKQPDIFKKTKIAGHDLKR